MRGNIDTAYTTVDFLPRRWGSWVFDGLPKLHGLNASIAYTNKKKKIAKDRIVYVRQSSGSWGSPLTGYKLVVSSLDQPWLFDLEKDPDELSNYGREGYEKPFQRLKKSCLPR